MDQIWKAQGEMMYSVVRFTASPPCLAALADVGTSMNAIRAGTYCGFRKAGDGFACTLSDSVDPEEHEIALRRFIDDFAEPLKAASALGASVTVDIAIEPEDRAGASVSVLRWESEMLQTAGASGLALEVSVY
jgi:hypothetical protein